MLFRSQQTVYRAVQEGLWLAGDPVICWHTVNITRREWDCGLLADFGYWYQPHYPWLAGADQSIPLATVRMRYVYRDCLWLLDTTDGARIGRVRLL